jgi:hypothetical protein
LLAALLVACGGGGGDGGGDGGGESGSLLISNLTYNPTSVYVNFGGGQVTVSGSVTFANASGGIASATIEIVDSGGATVSTNSAPAAGGAGVTSGMVSGNVLAGTSVVDNYTIRVWITDLAGRISNILTGSFRVARNPWTAKTPMPNPRQDFAVATSGGLVYVIGGELLGTGTFPGPASALVHIYDPATDSWSAGAPLPTARRNLAAATVNGVIYVIGGQTDVALDSTIVEAFDPAAPVPAWSTMAPMTTPRRAAAATALNGQVCVFGGQSSGNTISSVECFDPVANTWSPGPDMPTARYALGSDTVGAFAYAVGGHNLAGGPLMTVERFDPVNPPSWSSVTSMATRREAAAIVAASGSLFAIGGLDTGALDSVESYDPSLGTWKNKTSMPLPLIRLGAVTIGSSIFVFHSDNTLQYTPADDLL